MKRPNPEGGDLSAGWHGREPFDKLRTGVHAIRAKPTEVG
jgi:hypothetical protein